MRDADWVAVGKPTGKLEPLIPSAEIVRTTLIPWKPGCRLSADRKYVIDSDGYETRFYILDGFSIYARVTDPQRRVSWMRCVWRVVDL